MQLQRNVRVVALDPLHEPFGHHGAQEPGHVLDAERIGTHLHQPIGECGEALDGVHGARRVAQGALYVAACALHALERRLEIPRIVEGVEDAEDLHAVFDGAFAELEHDIIGVVAIADGVLAAEKHLRGGVLEARFHLAQPLPRVLEEEAHGCVEGGPAPAFDAAVADGIHPLQRGNHVLGAHTGGKERLMPIANRRLGDAHSTHARRGPSRPPDSAAGEAA